ncbi:MAG: Holliday junction resolvase RuvX [Rhodospirillaceae bacterium]|nr:Holliday junction resolvase RuvX [Rhodospirillaceae bacterium]MBT5245756.1 Holliday junction resolvase RuvX [Rhodospirillaceae bacterium]MBT5561454.1 Holliday junction resolvase RuvX [Rhodospirillaceae bacterium]MBT6242946.1 Holliday junction resolvase RuvX [Rhodospirillaceae bacterium]MBT7138066.1 Holliday junction resolvase RuvX [Rhodospirillaceae bacterium]
MELSEMIKNLKSGSRLMGLDLGSKTVGLALSDTTRMIASPLETIKRSKFTADAQRLESLIDEHDVGGLILGLPVSMDGSEGPRCQSTRAFATNLLARRDMALSFWDERLSTVAVERVLIDQADMTRKRRAEVVDKVAAAYILQGAMDAMARTTGP